MSTVLKGITLLAVGIVAVFVLCYYLMRGIMNQAEEDDDEWEDDDNQYY